MPKAKVGKPMVLITFHIPEELLKKLDEIVARGVFPSRSEAIRFAIIKLIEYIENRKLNELMLPGR